MAAPAAGFGPAPVPPVRTLPALRRAAAGCRACPLWTRGTQTVFGAGPARARLMVVGEQPGNDEDVRGRPFVGPAGRLLDAALAESGIDRGLVYVTNAVKHFKWVARGKRRIHERPSSREVAACRPWLAAEIATVKPRVLVLMGGTAAQALLGSGIRVTQVRGWPLASSLAPTVLATVHPSSILRAPDPEARRAAMAGFVQDLRAAARLLGEPHPPKNPQRTHRPDRR